MGSKTRACIQRSAKHCTLLRVSPAPSLRFCLSSNSVRSGRCEKNIEGFRMAGFRSPFRRLSGHVEVRFGSSPSVAVGFRAHSAMTVPWGIADFRRFDVY